MCKTLLFFLLSVGAVSLIYGQSDEELTRKTLDKKVIEGHIRFLASDELRGRDTGSPEIDIAARYLSSTFRRYGVSPVPGAVDGYFQPLRYGRIGYPETVSLSLEGMMADTTNMLLLAGNEVDFTGRKLIITDRDYSSEKLKGNVLINISSDSIAFREQMQASNTLEEKARKDGAAGLVEFVNIPGEMWSRAQGYLMTGMMGEFPARDGFFHLWINDPEGTAADPYLKKKNKEITARIGRRSVDTLQMKNVVGMVEGTDPELKKEYVIYSAHYDHLGIGTPNARGDSIYNGARDNAVGVVTVLSAAENIARFPTKRSALFILFTGEEKGLVGSHYYADHPMIPLDQMVFCFNSDNGGYNDTTVATIIGLGRTTEENRIREACEAFGLEAIDDPAQEQGLFDRSDNVSFAAKGIPAPTFSLGFRSFDAEIMKYYHQAADQADNLDYNYLEKFFGAYVLSCRLIANDPTTPFWLEGDKYYQSGMDLYQSQPGK